MERDCWGLLADDTGAVDTATVIIAVMAAHSGDEEERLGNRLAGHPESA